MHFLTKITLNVRDLRAHFIKDDNSLHCFVYSLFPKRDISDFPGRFLYADKGPRQNGRELVVLSQEIPDIPQGITSATLTLSPDFLQFPRYRFMIDMNPVKREASTGKRRPILGQLPLLTWFISLGEKNGFAVDPITLEAQVHPTRVCAKGDIERLFHHVTFRGNLEVKDTTLFQEAVYNGLGHGKAFGFGLLQLNPIS